MEFHSIPNIYYILRKLYSVKERRNMLKEVCCILKVVGLSHERVLNAIEREDFKDFEDWLQDECAVEINADYIITRIQIMIVLLFKRSNRKKY